MKRSIWLPGLVISVLLACEKDDTQPYDELPETIKAALNTEDCLCETKTELLKRGDQLLYHTYTQHPGCNMTPLFLDQEGNEVELGFDELQRFVLEAKRINTWTCGE